MKNNFNDTDLHNVLKALADKAEEEAQVDYETIFKDFFNVIGEKVPKWDNPEYVYNFFVHNVKSAIKRKCLEENNYSPKAASVILNYSTFDQIIKEMADVNQGCSADMSRWVLKEYISVLNDVTYIPTEINHEKYYMPYFGTTNDWLDFADGIFELIQFGKTQKFNECNFKLLKQKKEVLDLFARRQEAVKKFTPQFKEHLMSLYKNKKITKDEYDFCFTFYGSSVIWEFVDVFLENKYTITDEEIMAAISKYHY